MNNIKALSITADGTAQRLAITYDVVDDETGKVTKANKKMNRVVTDETVLTAIGSVKDFAQSIIDAE